MSFFGFSKNKSAVTWNDLNAISQLDVLEKESEEIPVLILKHSTRCSISAMAKNRLELYWDKDIPMKAYYLDLLNHRDISNEIAARYHIAHESPQVIVLKNRIPVFDASHTEIDYNTLKRNL
jgi:bacillithiol system protein YtxJ